MSKIARVHRVHAPAPRATAWAALLAACLASGVFLFLLALWRAFF
jgi:hypothetical protein